MTGTDLAVHQPTVLSNEQLKYIAETEFVPTGLRGNLPAILACVATGRALGIDDMTAIRSIHVIDGKATFSAELMVQLVRRAGHSITGEFTDGASTVVGTRADNQDSMKVTWTMAMADRAGLASKSNWKKYPESMLWARAVSQLCRMLFPDCFAGSTYTPEEMGDETPTEPGGIGGQSGAVDVATPSAIGNDAGPPGSVSVESEGDGLFPPAGIPEGLTAAQAKKLNVLVGRLREAGHIDTEHLYKALERQRPEGELHWAPLRDTLTKQEASELIERLTILEEKVTVPESGFKVPESARQEPLVVGKYPKNPYGNTVDLAASIDDEESP